MKQCVFFFAQLALSAMFTTANIVDAQPAKGAGKFLGNITTRGQVRTDYLKYWNQITGENETKWASVEGSRDKMNWKGTDSIAAFAARNGIPWKFHCLIWGSQYPSSWMNNLSKSEQLEEITEWFDESARRYPDVQMIDVVNEAYPSHKPAPFKDALGGDGATGFDWIIKVFEMARERWPKAILIYNDYNTIEYNSEVTWMVKLAEAMKKAKAPMDAIGVQAHDASRIATPTVKGNIDKLAATGYPIIVSEYDIPQSNDASQKKTMEEQFTMFWNHPKVIDITYWGYVVGSTWVNGSGLLNTNGTERPALTWLMDFVEKNPDPPNDYPKLIPESIVGVLSGETAFRSIQASTSRQSGEGLMKIFDLQGRVAGSFSISSRMNNTASISPASGSYIIKQNGHQKAAVVKVR